MANCVENLQTSVLGFIGKMHEHVEKADFLESRKKQQAEKRPKQETGQSV